MIFGNDFEDSTINGLHRALEDLFVYRVVSVVFSFIELETKFYSVAQLLKMILG